MREIKLTQRKAALVDDEDYPELAKFRWQAVKVKNIFYAARGSPRVNQKQVRIYMHRVVAGTPIGMETDHINGNGLDNRICNLRIVNDRENNQNLHTRKTSKFPGVSWHKQGRKWRAQIWVGEKNKNLGLFVLEEDAARAYVEACQNLIEETPIRGFHDRG